MNDTLQTLMREATRLTQSGRLTEATAVIQRALGGTAAAPAGSGTAVVASPWVIDGCVFEVDESDVPSPASSRPGEPAAHATTTDTRDGPEAFGSGTHSHAGLTRDYKLYLPPGSAATPLPLVVMLHGCNQDPDDFAAGTAMNERAREQGFAVLYPAQAQDANPQRCWNWFKHNHQQRGSGEPALLASLTQAVIERHGIDPRRVFVAGLSAGGAMAALVAASYPDVFAAVGVHSGLPAGAATDLPEALALMRSGVAMPLRGRPGRRTRPAPTAATPLRPVPTIVFHGDQDQTVHPRNGEQIIAAATGGAGPGIDRLVEQGVTPNGRRYTRVSHRGAQGGAVAEHWLVHGAGHAWAGGDAKGSYTDAQGPDATREMLRFFFEQVPRSAH